MHKGIRTALILCLILVVIGAGLVIAGIALGGSPNFTLDWENRKISTSSKADVIGDLTPQAFTTLEIDAVVADVTIERGESWSLRYALAEEPEITQANGVLRLKDRTHGKINFVGISVSGGNEAYVTVTVPADAALERIKLHTATGMVTLSDFTVGTLEAECNTGDFLLTNVTASELDLNGNTGSLELSNVTATFRAELETNTGDIIAEALSVPAGLEAETNTGDVKLSLTGTEADYALDLEADLGEVVVNGKPQGHRFHAGSGVSVSAETNTGDVRVQIG